MATHRGLFVATVALLATLPSPGRAALVTLDANGSSLSIAIGALPTLTVGATGSTPVLVSSGAGIFTEPASFFGPTTFQVTFTGVGVISGLTLAGAANQSVAVNGALGTGVGPLQGQLIQNILGLFNLSIPLSVVGSPGATAMVTAGGLLLSVVGQGWTTGVASVTDVSPSASLSSPVTVYQKGSDARTPAHGGTITLVSGFRIITGFAGILPAFATQTLSFVPEPGTLALLGTALVGCMIAARRGRRRAADARAVVPLPPRRATVHFPPRRGEMAHAQARSSCIFALALALLPAPSRAAPLTLEEVGSSLSLAIGPLWGGLVYSNVPLLSVDANASVPVLVSSAGGFTVPAGFFGPATFTAVPPTGTPILVTFLTVADLANGTIVVDGASGTGVGGLAGDLVLNVLQLLDLPISLTVVGIGDSRTLHEHVYTAYGQGWTTGVASVTWARFTPDGGTLELTTSTLSGSDARTPAHAGTITLVSGFHVVPHTIGEFPVFAIQTLSFSVPEPGSLGLLASGLAGCLWIGWRKRRPTRS